MMVETMVTADSLRPTVYRKDGDEVRLALGRLFRVEEGTGEAILDGVHTGISAGFAVLIPAGTNHNIVNTGSVPVKPYTLCAPPNHRDGVAHHTRAEGKNDNEHFDGRTAHIGGFVVGLVLTFLFRGHGAQAKG